MEFLAGVFQRFTEMSSTKIFTTMAGGLIIIVLCYFYMPYWGVRKVPGPPAMPIVGHLPLLAKYGPDVFSILANRYGPIFRFHMGRQPLVIVADPELCKEVGIKKFKSLPNRSIPPPLAATPLHCKGLFMTRDPRWSAMRNTVLSFYQPSSIAKLIPTMQEYIESATQNLDSKSDFTFSELSLKIATDVVGKASFGVDFSLSKPKSTGVNNEHDEGDDHHVREFINQHVYATTQLKMDLSGSISTIIGLLFPILQEPFRRLLMRIPYTMDWKIERTNQNLTNRLDDIVQNRMNNKDNNSYSGSMDFLSLVLGARESERATKNLFTPDYISAAAYEQLLAGSTTTSFTMSSVVYLVAGHPEVERKLLQEIDDFGPHDLIPTVDDLQHKFPYLDLVIKEALRFYTASPVVAREAVEQVTIGGYVLPKGTWVWMAFGVLAKDPKNFPEPDKFKPERFDPNSEEEKRRHPYANIPFGLGPRVCIGQKFSMQEMKLALIHMYRKYVFRHSPQMECPLEFEYGILLNFKHGVKVQAIKRA